MLFEQQCLDGSVVERVLGKDEVAGSNPARGFVLFLFLFYRFKFKSYFRESLNGLPIFNVNKKLTLYFMITVLLKDQVNIIF